MTDDLDKKLDAKLNKLTMQIFGEFARLRRELDYRFEAVGVKFSTLQSAVDGIAKGLEDERLERHALAAKVDRLAKR